MLKPVRYYIVKNGERPEVRTVSIAMSREVRSAPPAEAPAADAEPARVGPARRLADRLRKHAHAR